MYIVYPIVSTKTLLNLISEFDKVAGYEVNITKLMAFLYTDNDLSERETWKNNSTIKILLIYYRNKNNKVHRNKLNQGGKRPVLGKL